MTAWVMRAGRHGEAEQWCLAEGVAGGGWGEVPDLSECASRDDVRELVTRGMPQSSAGTVTNHVAQLWGLRQVEPGDLIVLPRKLTKTVAVGRCRSGYEYRPGEALPHVVSVEWIRTDTPRAQFKGDLLYTLGGIATIFRASRNSAEDRLRSMMGGRPDPGSQQASPSPTPSSPSGGAYDDAEVTDSATENLAPTLETIRDRVRVHVSENFKGHRLTHLVAAILEVRGFVCDVSPEGADQGVDILAGSGPLGLDSPTLIVEVKSEETQVAAPVVRGLQGAMLQNRSDQGLLMAWGGITKDAQREIRTDRLTMRVWDAENLLDELFDVYPQLPEWVRREIPLQQAWVLADEAG